MFCFVFSNQIKPKYLKMVGPTLTNRRSMLATVTNVRFAVLLANEPFAKKCPKVEQTFAALNTAQICSKLEGSLHLPFPNLTILNATYHHYPKVSTNCQRWTNCAIWEDSFFRTHRKGIHHTSKTILGKYCLYWFYLGQFWHEIVFRRVCTNRSQRKRQTTGIPTSCFSAHLDHMAVRQLVKTTLSSSRGSKDGWKYLSLVSFVDNNRQETRYIVRYAIVFLTTFRDFDLRWYYCTIQKYIVSPKWQGYKWQT